VAVKLAAVRRPYKTLVWRGLCLDSPDSGVKAPRDRTVREERGKFLPLEGLKKLLTAPEGAGPKARRDHAIQAPMGVHGLRVAEVTG
jgi:site-specific recombinase XerC